MKKSLKLIFLSFALAACTFGFAACGGGDDPDKDKTPGGDDQTQTQPGGDETDDKPSSGTEFTFEAEYTDVDGLVGAGSSNSAEGTDMILSATNASNGHYIGFTHKKDLTITFEINSDKAAAATLKIGLTPAEGMNAIKIAPSTFIVKVNGSAVTYTEQNVVDNNTNMNKRQFKKYSVGTVNLVAGKNTITLTIGDNDYVNGKAGGPSIDAIYITTEAALTWDPYEDNI